MKKIDAALLWAGIRITRAVGTMWCAIVFAAIALIGLPEAVTSGQFIPWLAQSFLQLVLLSVIMVGQDVQAARLEQLLRETHDITQAELAELKALHARRASRQ